jgi:hypothetical protein
VDFSPPFFYCSWIGVGIYVWRYRECSRIGQVFSSTNGYAYINDFLTVLYGFSCFFGTLKLIRLCRFNQRIFLLIQTLQQAGNGLISFAMMLSIVCFSFIYLFYFLFNFKLWSYSSLFIPIVLFVCMSMFDSSCISYICISFDDLLAIYDTKERKNKNMRH